MQVRAQAAKRLAIVLAAAAVVLTGCQAAGSPNSTAIPSSTPEPEPSAETQTFAPGEGRPVPTDGTFPETSATADEKPGPTIAQAVEVRIGEEDHSSLEWNVSCTGLDSSPTIIASASDEANTEYVVVVIGAGTDALASFTFTQTADGQSARERSGLTVNPGANQGNGSLDIEDLLITSTGRGISYDESSVQPHADTTFAVQFLCVE